MLVNDQFRAGGLAMADSKNKKPQAAGQLHGGLEKASARASIQTETAHETPRIRNRF